MMRGLGIFVFGGITSFGIAISTAVIRYFIKRPSGCHLQPTDTAENDIIEKDGSRGETDAQQDVPTVATHLIKQMRGKTETDFTYDSTVCAERCGEGFYSKKSFSQYQSSVSDLANFLTSMGTIGIEKTFSKIRDHDISSKEMFPKCEELIVSENMTKSCNNTPVKLPGISPEKLITCSTRLQRVLIASMVQERTSKIFITPQDTKSLKDIPEQLTTEAARRTAIRIHSTDNTNKGVRTKLLGLIHREKKVLHNSETASQIIDNTALRSKSGRVESNMVGLLENNRMTKPLKASSSHHTATEEPINDKYVTKVFEFVIYNDDTPEECAGDIRVDEECEASIVENITAQKSFENTCITKEHRDLILYHWILEVRTQDNCITVEIENPVLEGKLLVVSGMCAHIIQERKKPPSSKPDA